ncbi:MAG: N-acetylmuramoyl-L-alanine amidase, partial [Mesorhizobium sp.]
YEGFEANEHVVYMHACPNQHLVPLLAHVVPRFGANGFLLGSNYIWGWETNRVARDLIADAGGKVLGERYRQGDSAPSIMPASSFEAAAYASVRTLAEILARNPGAQWPDLPQAFAGTSFRTPLGDISIDPQTQHATLPVQIGRIEGTAFKTVTLTKGVAPDPYLSR